MRGIQIEHELQLQSVCGCLRSNICVCECNSECFVKPELVLLCIVFRVLGNKCDWPVCGVNSRLCERVSQTFLCDFISSLLVSELCLTSRAALDSNDMSSCHRSN